MFITACTKANLPFLARRANQDVKHKYIHYCHIKWGILGYCNYFFLTLGTNHTYPCSYSILAFDVTSFAQYE